MSMNFLVLLVRTGHVSEFIMIKTNWDKEYLLTVRKIKQITLNNVQNSKRKRKRGREGFICL